MKKELLIGGAILLGVSKLIDIVVVAKQAKDIKNLQNDLSITKSTIVEKMANSIDVDIPDEYIEKAVKKAVEREAQYTISRMTNDLTQSMRIDIRDNVAKNVDDAYSDIKNMVKDELTRQVGRLSIESIRREVIAEAKETAAEKFEKDLDLILDKHNAELDKVTTIYSSIAKSMRGDK